MNKLRAEIDNLLSAEPFAPFVVTSADGFAIAVRSAKRALLGQRMLVVTDESGRLYHFPLGGITHLSEADNGEIS